MADIKLKDVKELSTWNAKELRKLKITINNRVSTLEKSSKPKELPSSHPLFEMGVESCQNLLKEVLLAEKNLK